VTIIHGKGTVVILGGVDLSAFSKKAGWERAGTPHDTTVFGLDDERYQGGLRKGQASIEGDYDSTAGTGPRAVINPLINTVTTLVRRPEGTGVGKPQDSVNVFVEKYTETSAVEDMVKWAVDLKLSGPVTSSVQ
jgi:hypothetical protein